MASNLDLTVLAALVEAGGSGELDVRGRVIVGRNPPRPISADLTSRMRRVAAGRAAGENGKIIATEEGRKLTSRLIGGYTAGHDGRTAG